jgi:hypothetical protein
VIPNAAPISDHVSRYWLLASAHELATHVAGFLLDTSHQQRLSKRTLDATATGGHECPKRRAHDMPLLSGQSIDLHQHLLDRTNRIEGAELAGAKREVNSIQRSTQLATRRALRN